jgi:DNA-binding response OmpR family regulator
MDPNYYAQILLVEDEISLARSIQLELTHVHYVVEIAQNGYEALGKFAANQWDLILLDLLLPGLDGFQVCQKMKDNSDTPIIILSALDSTSDKVRGFNLGADDYLTKPFAMEELLVRIRARLKDRPMAKQGKHKLMIKDLIIRYDTRQVTREGKYIPLSRREFDLLYYLAENAGVVLTREAILAEVWGYDLVHDTNVVDVYIRYLRSKIDEPFAVPLIQTIRGVGYTLREEK